MRIGINICDSEKIDGQSNQFVIDCFKKLAIKNPQHHFVFITDKAMDENEKSAIVTITPRPKNTLFWKFWYNYILDTAATKHKIDLLINCNGICPLNSKTPQYLLMSDLPVLHSSIFPPNWFRFYKKNSILFLQKSKRIITTCTFLQEEIISKYKIDNQKIDIIYPGIDAIYKPISFEEKEEIKVKYTQEKEFFLYAGEINTEKNLVILLKAFSFFKKRQKSNMQLIILANTIDGTGFIESLKTYKYREEVKLLQDISFEEQTKITGAAYAFVCPSLYESFPIKIIEAMRAGVPVIANNLKAINETCGDAVLYADATNFEEIAHKMMLLFKDENKRNELSVKVIEQALQYNMDKMTNELWQSIIKTTPA